METRQGADNALAGSEAGELHDGLRGATKANKGRGSSGSNLRKRENFPDESLRAPCRVSHLRSS